MFNKIIDFLANILGIFLNKIYIILSKFGLGNIGLCIICMTFVFFFFHFFIYLYQRKKGMKIDRQNIEIQKAHNDCKEEFAKGGYTNEEMDAIFEEKKEKIMKKYNLKGHFNVILILQILLFMAIYGVVRDVPEHVDGVKTLFSDSVSSIMNTKNYQSKIKDFYEKNDMGTLPEDYFKEDPEAAVRNTLYHLTAQEWDSFIEEFPENRASLLNTQKQISLINTFMEIDLAKSPSKYFQDARSGNGWKIFFFSLLIPAIVCIFRMIIIKLECSLNCGDSKVVRYGMQAMVTYQLMLSVFSCFILPCGLGLYWMTSTFCQILENRLSKIVLKKKEREMRDFADRLLRNSETGRIQKAKV